MLKQCSRKMLTIHFIKYECNARTQTRCVSGARYNPMKHVRARKPSTLLRYITNSEFSIAARAIPRHSPGTAPLMESDIKT